jgi:hypothetical protein
MCAHFIPLIVIVLHAENNVKYIPTYISGGLGEDTTRAVKGVVAYAKTITSIRTDNMLATGAFYPANARVANTAQWVQENHATADIGFNSGLVVKTGPENSPRTLAARYWRLVSL